MYSEACQSVEDAQTNAQILEICRYVQKQSLLYMPTPSENDHLRALGEAERKIFAQ